MKSYFFLFLILNIAFASAFPIFNYKPFGEVLTDGKSKYLYTGKEKDSESGLMYYGARYYNPGIGRFTQADSELQNIYNPQLLNRYSYVANNPYKYADDSGNFITLPAAVIGAVAGGLIGGGLSLGGQLISSGGNFDKVSWSDVGLGAAVGAVAGGVAGLTGGASLVASIGGDVNKAEKANDVKNIGKASKDLLPEVKAITDSKQKHILQDKHDWGKVVKDPKEWNQISEVIDKTLQAGDIGTYKTVQKSTLKINNEVVTVTWKTDERGLRKISDAWVNKK